MQKFGQIINVDNKQTGNSRMKQFSSSIEQKSYGEIFYVSTTQYSNNWRKSFVLLRLNKCKIAISLPVTDKQNNTDAGNCILTL